MLHCSILVLCCTTLTYVSLTNLHDDRACFSHCIVFVRRFLIGSGYHKIDARYLSFIYSVAEC